MIAVRRRRPTEFNGDRSRKRHICEKHKKSSTWHEKFDPVRCLRPYRNLIAVKYGANKVHVCSNLKAGRFEFSGDRLQPAQVIISTSTFAGLTVQVCPMTRKSDIIVTADADDDGVKQGGRGALMSTEIYLKFEDSSVLREQTYGTL
ncbi:unnamed protein product [Soboliphyme baturini]|uniref:Amino_oxidase domain-containing protein n=1 Tax=Soboliphyme baturini TaxID=241478 RepID=A0A183IJP4_9BILA|nr:unnamed protein product [Soboliphyme baturini]